jgi:hypothetical protein
MPPSPISFGAFLAGVDEHYRIRGYPGATRRLLNFFWLASGAGKPVCGGWMTVNRRWVDSYGRALMPSTAGTASERQVLESWLDSDAVNAWIK